MKSNWLYKLERKFGKLAIHNLTTIMVGFYIVGVVLELMSSSSGVDIVGALALNPYLILHGEVWRLVSWLLIVPGGQQNILFVIIAIMFYMSIGKMLEQVWGDFKYTVYILSGILFTIIAAFGLYGYAWFFGYKDVIATGVVDVGGITADVTVKQLFTENGITNILTGDNFLFPGAWFKEISTTYISMSLFLAYAATFPNNLVLLMFIIPLRVKVLGYITGGLMLFSAIEYVLNGYYFMLVIMVMALLNFLLFFFTTSRYNRINIAEVRRRAAYRQQMREAEVHSRQEAQHEGKQVFTRHKCAICGKTELDSPDLQFRFCSKCEGNYEYCEEHLFTHEHVKRI